MNYLQELQAIEDEELKAICDEIRSHGDDVVSAIERQYEQPLEKVKLRTLLIALRNLHEK